MEIPPYLPTPLFAHCAPLGRLLLNQRCWRESVAIHPSDPSDPSIRPLRYLPERKQSILEIRWYLQEKCNISPTRMHRDCASATYTMLPCCLSPRPSQVQKFHNTLGNFAVKISRQQFSTDCYLLTYKRLPNLDFRNFEIPFLTYE